MGLARWLADNGHRPSILAPGRPRPDVLSGYELAPVSYTSIGRALAIRYNGSVARVNFGPLTARRTREWLRADDFDLVHVHEPLTPSAALFATTMARVPVVATYHLDTPRSRPLRLAGRAFAGTLTRIGAHIAVSRAAQRTIRKHLGIDPGIIPNGFRAADFEAHGGSLQAGQRGHQIMFLGRIDEPRKGLDVLLAALPAIRNAIPEAGVWVVGSGRRTLPPGVQHLGAVSDSRRAELLRQAAVFVAPHLGRESFGLVLVEAMAAGTPVVASDLPAFGDVLTGDRGRPLGRQFPRGDPTALAAAVVETLARPDPERCRLAASHARGFDWDVVGPRIAQVYNDVVIA